MLLFPLLLPAQKPNRHAPDTLQQYVTAISEYLHTIEKEKHTVPDTLFLLKNEEFPDIRLPRLINKVPVVILTDTVVKQKLNYRSSLFLVNLFGWFSKNQTEFLFVLFANGYQYQYDVQLWYEYSNQQELQLKKSKFRYPEK